ncbi:fibronectin type III-like domain-contianing protein [Tessaracoccus coleopterorum]|uniref:fibronectin type III-like domain-contianing protein n=1 Tax=Tessaracoccus coleopterorum TaxID=2714950 RepID=UPI0018D34810|nr:fibronectin type III-like domain-contianing protein [Tessaracoccus coleopterorum]
MKGFAKVALLPGESKVVRVTLDGHAFAYYNVDVDRWVVQAGTHTVAVGASSRDLRLTTSVDVSGEDLPFPYDATRLPHYFSGAVKGVDGAEFEALL